MIFPLRINIFEVVKFFILLWEVTIAMITTMSTRGQITIPKKIRTALKLEAGTLFVVSVDQDNILLKPIKEPMLSNIEQLLNKAQKFASNNNMQISDITKAIKSVRKMSSK